MWLDRAWPMRSRCFFSVCIVGIKPAHRPNTKKNHQDAQKTKKNMERAPVVQKINTTMRGSLPLPIGTPSSKGKADNKAAQHIGFQAAPSQSRDNFGYSGPAPVNSSAIGKS